MVRKMAYVGFSYLLGLFFASFFFSGTVLIFGAIAALAAAVLLIFRKKLKSCAVAVCLISFGIGCIFYSLYDNCVYNNICGYSGTEGELKGVITEYKELHGNRASYTVKGSINESDTVKVICYGTSRSCEIGDEIVVKGKFTLPSVSYTFDGKAYYKSKGIYLIMNASELPEIILRNRLPVKRALFRYRDYIYDRFDDYLSTDEEAVIRAMLFGDKTGLEDSTKALLYRAGIGHMMAVSGVHLSIICSLIWYVLCTLPLNKYIRFAVLLLFMAVFAILAGASESVMRAAVMLGLVYGAELFDRRADTANSLGIAVILLTLGCPFAVRDASFMLSVAGVSGIGIIAPPVISAVEEKKKLGPLMKSVLASLCITATIFPVSFLFFDEISIVSPLTNLVMLPLCTVILICGMITALTGGVGFIAFPLLKIAGLCSRVVLALAKLVGGFELSYVPLGYDFTKWLIAAAIILVVIFAAINKKGKFISAAAVVSFSAVVMFTFLYRFIPSDNITMAVLNNGKGGSSVVIHNKKSASVIDLTKGGSASDCVTKYLRRLGIGRVDMLVLAVDDNTSETVYMNDLELFEVGTVLIPERQADPGYSVHLGKNTVQYRTDCPFKADMPYFSLTSGEDSFQIDIKDVSVLAYGSLENVRSKGNYHVMIDYGGKKNKPDLSGKINILINDKADMIETENSVYIGDCVAVTVGKNEMKWRVI